ncbi:hypothetical protein Tco_1106500 [Tanacetum coccineum]
MRYRQNRGYFNQASSLPPPVHQGQVYRPQVVQPPAYQAPAYQAPAPQIQGVSKEDFHSYVKANDAVMRNMQTQAMGTASTSGTLLVTPFTYTTPKEDLKEPFTTTLQGNYFPEISKRDLKICEANHENSSVNEPPEVELKDLPPHLEYAFLEGDDKLPVIIAKDLKNEEKAALIKVLKSHNRAIAETFIYQGYNPEFVPTKSKWKKDDYEPTVQHQDG